MIESSNILDFSRNKSNNKVIRFDISGDSKKFINKLKKLKNQRLFQF